MLKLAIVAGEPSGDLLAGALIRALRARHRDLHFEGIAGPEMIKAGCDCLVPLERLSVMGLIEVLGRYPGLVRLRRRLIRRWIADPPDIVVGVDAPDFNLTLELALRRAGVRTVHFVSPSVWAWRQYRVRKIKRAVDMMLTLFPFEEDFYAKHRIPVRFVGHPFADEIEMDPDRDEARTRLGLESQGVIVALLPGSRIGELGALAEPIVRTARWIHRRRPEIRFVGALANPSTFDLFSQALARHAPDLPCSVFLGGARDAMTASDAVLLASGTATLEAMLIKRPMVITYRAKRLTWELGRRLLKAPHIGLPNLLAGERLVPELLQDDAVPERLGPAVLECLDHPQPERIDTFRRIHRRLRNDAAAKAAEAVLEVALGK
ncbi:lipid-A-disaccharide synthase [Thioalkalivibrio sp. HK1]|uniref:lipid-A-disaccharide synthase n=1 Tax=Thioalkalivibrio sp. HK1 TaxID=1469245 RepID=UPI0004AC6958|nr:lipid-A-disaccharide synthase [Thioalkalivibrio sp. HK1]